LWKSSGGGSFSGDAFGLGAAAARSPLGAAPAARRAAMAAAILALGEDDERHVGLVDAEPEGVAGGADRAEAAAHPRGLDLAPLAVRQLGIVVHGEQPACPAQRRRRRRLVTRGNVPEHAARRSR
jgi:hypothetical protein